ncbi:cytochrome b5 domain-containing protein [Anaerotalea alkaliphila]|nr:cytochrome b5 domain-containing protein [Anaerotalea alkaliphila]
MKTRKMRLLLFLIIPLALTLALAACGSKAPAVNGSQAEELVLTLEELAAFDGKDGNPAYVAVDGVIYDVTESRPWSGGEHNGFSAGKDLTREIKEVSPHGVSKLVGIPVVGRLADTP